MAFFHVSMVKAILMGNFVASYQTFFYCSNQTCKRILTRKILFFILHQYWLKLHLAINVCLKKNVTINPFEMTNTLIF